MEAKIDENCPDDCTFKHSSKVGETCFLFVTPKLWEAYSCPREESISKDADREMIGNDADFIDDVGSK
jgi:hypothetical protein